MSLFSCVSPQPPPAPAVDLFASKRMDSNAPMNYTNSTQKDATSNLVDLEEIVTNWARTIFDVTKSKQEAKIKKKYLSFNINWTKLFQESAEPEYEGGGVDPHKIGRPKEEKCLFRTVFRNVTQREQEYSFKTERSTRSSSTVIVEKGVCRGVNLELKLKTPCEVVEAGAGFSQEVSLNHIGENTCEEELCWGVDSNVRVPPRSETVAELVVLEESTTRSFKIHNRLHGKVIVTVTNLKQNNSLVTILEGNMADIVRGMSDYAQKGFSFAPDNKNVVCFETSGTCVFRYGVEQRVKIRESAIYRDSTDHH